MNTNKIYRAGAAGALLDEYEKTINELAATINGIDNSALSALIDPATADPNCRSVQSILTHVVSAGYGYACYIRKLKGHAGSFPEKITRQSVSAYEDDLKAMFRFTVNTFNDIAEHELEEPANDNKMLVSWGQLYDIEQLMEHAIVHILRHRRQVERFMLAYTKGEQL